MLESNAKNTLCPHIDYPGWNGYHKFAYTEKGNCITRKCMSWVPTDESNGYCAKNEKET